MKDTFLAQFLTRILHRHKRFWTGPRRLMLVKAVGFLFMALIVQSVANEYVENLKGLSVGDIFLDHLPTLNLDFMVVQGALLVTFFIVLLMIWQPKYLIFTMIAFSIFVIVRAFFISLTHLGVNPHEITLNTERIGYSLYNFLYNSKSDFFFSGHTGAPFLMGLIFWDHRRLRTIFFGISFLFGVSVLLGHIHYSIDVFAAPFITYTIFVIVKKYFPKEHDLMGVE